MESLFVLVLVLDYIEGEQNSGYKFVSSIKPLIFGLNHKDGICMCILCILK